MTSSAPTPPVLHLHVPESLHTHVRVLSALAGTSMADYVRGLVRADVTGRGLDPDTAPTLDTPRRAV